jgi:hypothetical protein
MLGGLASPKISHQWIHPLAAAAAEPFLTSIDSLRFSSCRYSIPPLKCRRSGNQHDLAVESALFRKSMGFLNLL